MVSGPNSSKAKVRSGCCSRAASMRASLTSRSGSGDSFQVLVRWKVISWSSQQPAGPLAADAHDPARVVGQIADQLAQAPVGERLPQLARSGGGHLDEEALVLSADPAGTATRPARVQRPHPEFVEPVD